MISKRKEKTKKSCIYLTLFLKKGYNKIKIRNEYLRLKKIRFAEKHTGKDKILRMVTHDNSR